MPLCSLYFRFWHGTKAGLRWARNGVLVGALGWLAALSPAWAGNWPLTGAIGAHDPTIIKEAALWWCFTTGQGLPVKYSPDGLAWTQGVRLFETELPWWRTYAPQMGNLDVWAPDLQFFANRYWCFYCVSEFGKNNSAIGLKSCSSILAGDWRDDGLVISSKSGVDAYNAIDPSLTIDAAGNPWLVFGSFFDGIHLVQLDPTTMKPMGTNYNIARRSGGIEAPNIVYNNGYYYLFVSIDTCCQGVNSTYKIAYGRSTSITGPYVDKNNLPMLSGATSLLDTGDNRYKGPGGQDVYQNGSAWIIAHHAYDALSGGSPVLLISDLYFDIDNWPSYTAPPLAAPVITTNPVSQTVAAGSNVTFSAAATGSNLSYAWQKNGVTLAGATSATLSLNSVQGGDGGDYTVIISNSSGASTSNPATLTVANPVAGRLTNLSVRTVAGSGSATLIAGFIIGGNGSKTVVVRGTGQTLALSPFNLTGVLADPLLTLAPLNQPTLLTNDSWGAAPNLSAIVATGLTNLGPVPMDAKDAIMMISVPSGGYTAQLTNVGGGSGIGLVEVFDTDNTLPGTPGFDTQPRLANLSARAQVNTGSGVLIAGFICNGTSPLHLLIRATGPTLAQPPFNVTGVLADPKLELRRLSDSKLFAQNDDWGSAPNQSEIIAANGHTLASVPVNAKDSVLVVTIAPGAYTAIVSGVNNTSGVALLEIYELL